ncbi:universal stress protein [Roseovarius sp.]|uniref:universal stress protein n=1 Tax=Roseovarius sp. TaxID=1486281 RepID=UPI003A96E64A
MPVKTIALVIFDSAEAEWLINKGCSLAQSLDAHVIGLHSFSRFVFYEGMGEAPMISETIQNWEKEESDKINALFDEMARKNGLRAEFRRQDALYGNEAFLLAGARGADLVVMGSNGSGTRAPDDQSMAERLIRNLGRPVLVVSPESDTSASFDTITIAWSETREATRAAHDAIELAKPGASIDLIALTARASDEKPGLDSRDDFAAALDRRGFKATTTDRMATVENRGDELLRVAAESHADLLVAGAFGHSQVYDFMIGSVTTRLLKNAKLPVLLSH